MNPAAALPAGLLAAALLACAVADLGARQPRSKAERAAYHRAHPCPSTGQTRGACPGYVVDHIEPLCAGGSDRPRNMQWQQIDEAKAKDRQEHALCRRLRAAR